MKQFVFFIAILISGCRSYVKHGTTILVSLSKDTIILMADSRAEIALVGKKSPYYIDTINKIRRIGNYFCEIAGVSHFRNTDLYDIVVNNFNPENTFEKNLEVLNSKVDSTLSEYYNSLDNNELKYYHRAIPTWASTTIFIAGFEAGDKLVYQMEFRVERQPLNYSVSRGNSSVYKTDETGYGIFHAGFHENISKAIAAGYPFTNLHIKDLAYFISLEADASEGVGHDYNFVIVTKNGYQAGKSY